MSEGLTPASEPKARNQRTSTPKKTNLTLWGAQTHPAACLFSPQRDGREVWKGKSEKTHGLRAREFKMGEGERQCVLKKQLLPTGSPVPHSPWVNGSFGKALAPRFITEHDVIWYGISLWSAGVSCPGCVPSQSPAHSQATRWWGGVRSREGLDAV